MDVDERFRLVSEVGEEVIEPSELRELLSSKSEFLVYDGFEPSGSLHIAQALFRVINIKKIISAGGSFILLVADWHAWANHKFGGDLGKIRKAGEYFIEVWKAAGVDFSKVRVLWASELVKDSEYWGLVMRVANLSTLKRVLRTTQIMGRSEKDVLSASQIIYPCMQVADVFYLGVDVCQLGMDQRKVNVLARELAPKLGFKKPVIVSHHMLMGLGEPPKTSDAVERAVLMKMSKSRPETSIFVSDSEEEVVRKLKKAYCPARVEVDNPVLEYFRYIIFELFSEVVVDRPEKFGGRVVYSSYESLRDDFVSGGLHPLDLKLAAARYINEALSPIRKYFSENSEARKLQAEVLSF